ncbi:MAG: c-type cytochrome [Planctomycetota bacterium]|nr:c-type cytochrome [Planctomycetota bacterium]
MSRCCANRYTKIFAVVLALGPASWLTSEMGLSNASAQWSQTPELVASQVADQQAEPAKNVPPNINWGSGPKPQWIWGDDVTKDYRLSIDFEAPSSEGWLRATCDNSMTLYLNGERLASSDTWEQAEQVNLGRALKKGKNTLVAEVSNEGNVGGFVAKLALLQKGKVSDWVVTNSQWKATLKKSDDGAKAAKTVADLGASPWGNVLDTAGGVASSAPRDVFILQPGFQVERMFTVPKDELGSWVSITFDPQGRLLASDQGGKGICRITLPEPGSMKKVQVEKLDLAITSAQGMLFAFESLYFSVNGGPGSGLYRARDTNGDDQFDELVKLKDFRGGGEHGPHALRLSPDGKHIVVICGNHTDPPGDFDTSRLPSNWSEDHLLPRQWDARGHARGKLAPGGWIAQTDPDGKTWEMLSVGYRNPYDMDFNADGELFAYDADMEWDLGTPWYRPTRVVHATSGSEFGWRSGTGKWPTYYEDSLPPAINIGPGSPVGAAFGYGAKFPAKYQKALYICDWTFGTMYAIHLKPEGASYTATKEEFVARTPLPLTDVAIGRDGAMYFTIGGRGTQSELFRVTYKGDAPTVAVDPREKTGTEARALRHKLEALHHGDVKNTAEALKLIWPNLGNEDRAIRYAARVALENLPVASWRDKIVGESSVRAATSALIALARQGDESDRPLVIKQLIGTPLADLNESELLGYARAAQLALVRLGRPDDASVESLRTHLEPHFPNESDRVNREWVQLLVYLDSPNVVAKTIELMKQPKSEKIDEDLAELITRNRGYGGPISNMLSNHPDLQQMHFAFVLRNATAGWTVERRQQYFEWFNKARNWSGGASFQGFLNNIDQEAYENATDNERLAVEALGARKPYVAPERPKPQGPGQDWTLKAVMESAGEQLKGRDFKNGERTFASANCVLCHRFAGNGGATGPDLTQTAGRFGIKDLTEALIDPNKVISDQYRASVVSTVDGNQITGRIVSENDDELVILIDPEDSSKIATIAAEDVEEVTPSPVSLMPADLLDTLNENEVLDLLAYLLSRGNPNDPMFR